MAAILIFGSGL